MLPIGSTPSKPASRIILNLSITDNVPGTVANMMPFLIPRLDVAAFSSAPNADGNTAAASTPAPAFTNCRRFNSMLIKLF